MDGIALLQYGSRLDLVVAQAVIEEALKLQDQMRTALARQIRNEIAQALNGQ